MSTLNASTAAPASITRLDLAAWYRTPTGRLVRLVALDGRGGVEPIARLEYVNPEGKGQGYDWGDGFNLRQQNWRILRRVG